MWAWGANGNGQLGNGTTNNSALPVQVKDSTGTGYLNNIISIDAGGNSQGDYTVALKNDGTVWAWGAGNYGN